MIDIFLQKDAKKLFKYKNIVFMGDSNMRALYKDTLCLLSHDRLISRKILRTKGESSCFGDKLLSCGPRYNGREYREEREGSISNTVLSFYFLTRVYDEYVQQIVRDLSRNPQNLPDVLVINSCLWDVTRWGPNSVKPYKRNLVLLMQDLKQRMPDCLIIWVTAPPIACAPTGGFLVKEIEFLKYSIRFHVVEANHYARKVAVDHGFDVVDSHYHLQLQIHRRTPDGIHWYPEAVRYVTNLLLTHISIAWNVTLPHRFMSKMVDEYPVSTSKEKKTVEQNKVSSVVVEPDVLEKCTDDKHKENNQKKAIVFATPKRRKKRKRSQKNKSKNFQESHHSFLKRVEYRERHNRIRQWEKPDENLSNNMKAYNSSHENQKDFRYYSNFEPCNSYNQQKFINSPSSSHYIQPNDYFVHSSSNNVSNITIDLQRYINSPRHIPLPLSSYPSPNNGFFNSSFSENDTRMHAQECIPIRNINISPYRSFASNSCQNLFLSDLRNSPLLTNNRLQFQPKIDFASTDNVPFGIQF